MRIAQNPWGLFLRRSVIIFPMTSLEGSELSERELDILRLVATGASNKEIAQKLFISPNTVKVHLRNIFTKIGALSRTEAALYAIHQGLVKSGSPTDSVNQAVSLPISIQEPSSTPLQEHAHTSSAKSTLWIGLFLLVLVLVGAAGFMLAAWKKFQPSQALADLTQTPVSTPASASGLQARWKALPPMKEARSGLAAAAVDGHIYAIGGKGAQGVTGAVEAYDPATQTWFECKALPLPVTDIKAGVLGGKIYVPGGKLSNGEISASLEIYDPLSDGWQSGPDLPYPVSAYALATFEGKLYLFGGWDGMQILNGVLEYDPSLETWSVRSPLPTGRAFSAAAAAGGKIYVVGGFDGENSLSVNEAYTPSLEGSSSSPWTSAPPIPEKIYDMSAASVVDTLLILGGTDLNDKGASSFHFFPSLGTWVEEEQPIPQPWTGLAAVPFEQFVYVVGGTLGKQATSQLKSYQAVYTILIPIVP